jgi:hypothetical protein
MNNTTFRSHFKDGAYLEISGDTDDVYVVEFIDRDTNTIEYTESITSGHWLRTEKRYFINWLILVRDVTGNIVYQDELDINEKNVVINIDNAALGDAIAWIPYCDVFRQKHNCELTVHTILHEVFAPLYPSITWEPKFTGEVDSIDCYAYYMIAIGIDNEIFGNGIRKLNHYFLNNIPIKFIPNLTFHDRRFHKEHPYKTPLQKVMTNYFNLEYKELRPQLPIVNPLRPMEKKYVCISEHASSEGMKMWNNKVGWRTLISEIKRNGYEVVSISREKSNLDNIIKRNGDHSLNDRVWYLQHCEFFVGLGSGLSWLAWAAGAKVVMIAGHSEEWVEFSENCIRIINKDVCHGCYNNEEHMDKLCCYHNTYCPTGKNFVCTRAISPKMVIEKIKENNLL